MKGRTNSHTSASFIDTEAHNAEHMSKAANHFGVGFSVVSSAVSSLSEAKYIGCLTTSKVRLRIFPTTRRIEW